MRHRLVLRLRPLDYAVGQAVVRLVRCLRHLVVPKASYVSTDLADGFAIEETGVAKCCLDEVSQQLELSIPVDVPVGLSLPTELLNPTEELALDRRSLTSCWHLLLPDSAGLLHVPHGRRH